MLTLLNIDVPFAFTMSFIVSQRWWNTPFHTHTGVKPFFKVRKASWETVVYIPPAVKLNLVKELPQLSPSTRIVLLPGTSLPLSGWGGCKEGFIGDDSGAGLCKRRDTRGKIEVLKVLKVSISIIYLSLQPPIYSSSQSANGFQEL